MAPVENAPKDGTVIDPPSTSGGTPEIPMDNANGGHRHDTLLLQRSTESNAAN